MLILLLPGNGGDALLLLSSRPLPRAPASSRSTRGSAEVVSQSTCAFLGELRACAIDYALQFVSEPASRFAASCLVRQNQGKTHRSSFGKFCLETCTGNRRTSRTVCVYVWAPTAHPHSLTPHAAQRSLPMDSTCNRLLPQSQASSHSYPPPIPPSMLPLRAADSIGHGGFVSMRRRIHLYHLGLNDGPATTRGAASADLRIFAERIDFR